MNFSELQRDDSRRRGRAAQPRARPRQQTHRDDLRPDQYKMRAPLRQQGCPRYGTPALSQTEVVPMHTVALQLASATISATRHFSNAPARAAAQMIRVGG